MNLDFSGRIAQTRFELAVARVINRSNALIDTPNIDKGLREAAAAAMDAALAYQKEPSSETMHTTVSTFRIFTVALSTFANGADKQAKEFIIAVNALIREGNAILSGDVNKERQSPKR